MTPREEAILLETTEVMREVFGDPALAVTASTSAQDVPGWDSLNHTTLIARVEAHFQIKFTLREVMRFRNVGDMCTVIAAKRPA